MIQVKLIAFNSKDYFQTLGLRYEVLRRPLDLHFIPEDLEQEFTDVHVAAFHENRVVGCLILTRMKLSEKILKMRQVAVHDRYQGKGIGKLMVHYAEKWAIENHFEKYELHARDNAVPFYLTLGYQVIGNQFVEVNIPHFKMIKLL